MEAKSEKKHILPSSTAACVMFVILLAFEAAFIVVMMVLDVLPGKYVAAGLIVLLAVDAGTLLLLRGKKKGTVACGVILAVLACAVLCIGTVYMYDTYKTLQKISEYNEHFEIYDAIVKSDSSYDNAADIAGKSVYSFKNDSKMYQEACEKLITKAGVTFETVDDCEAAIEELKTSSSGENAVIFIPDNNYQVICEEEEDFKDDTKVICRIKVVKREQDNAGRVDVTQDPFNVCITGIDMWGKIDQVSRSDVNMIITVNPQNKTILLTSMPRDSYVVLHSFDEYDKLTHTGVWGVDETISTIEDWLDVDINYFVRVDFSMLVDIVNAIDGIDVYSDYDFKSAISKYKYHKGWNHLNGKAALYFARERKAFEDEDQQRIKNQQKVMKACLKKVTGSTALLTNYTKLLDAVDDEMETSMSEDEMADLVKMQLDDMSSWKITCQSVQGDLTMKGTYTMGMGRELLVSIPREESVEKVKKGIQKAMYPTDTKYVFSEDE